jgi:hypothetical protein
MQKNYYEMSERATAQIEIDYLREEVAKLKQKLNDVENARALLKSKGYFTDNLWCIDDVTNNYDCTEDDAQEVLKIALTDDVITERIFSAIDDACDELSIKQLNQ